jgi:hypothetical protein
MYDGWKIIVGLIIGVALLAYPFWPSMEKWAAKTPEPELTAKAQEAKVCVEPKSYIRTEHMKLLDQWRDSVVRNGIRQYKNSTGKVYDISLQNTCMKCHSNKSKFCDQCHTYAAVDPFCWECHIQPEEKI